MSNHRKAMTFLYVGVLMALIAADWHWYAGKYPDGSFILRLPYIKILYLVYLVIMAVCLIAAGNFFWKDRPRKTGHLKREKHLGERR